ncbi:MAG: hypothetical protein JHD19_27215 [Pseudomonas sp.]|nr:hypothetical protein [Pseudomonas sp.]
MGLLVVLVQVVNLVGAYREVMKQTRDRKKRADFFAALAATGAAGFTAAQGLADTALKARSTSLVGSLQLEALQQVRVQMGKLHVGLGFFTYFFGLRTSITSLGNQDRKWQDAIRSGTPSEQRAAALATLGAAGMVAANGYGASNTVYASFKVFTAPNSSARTAAWAAAGTRLSLVFFRFNLAGALFTVLEFVGTWLFNRYNLSAHEKWLKITPWSRDDEMRGDHSLDDYQNYLAFLIHAPYAQSGPDPSDTWLKTLLFGAKPSDIHLVLPRLALNDLLPPLNGKPSQRLGIGGHRLVAPLHGRGVPQVRKEVISEEILSSLRIVKSSTDGLVLCLQYPIRHDSDYTPAKETLELAICIQTVNGKGGAESRTRVIHIDPLDSGHFAVVTPGSVKDNPPVLLVETQYLEWADHAE